MLNMRKPAENQFPRNEKAQDLKVLNVTRPNSTRAKLNMLEPIIKNTNSECCETEDSSDTLPQSHGLAWKQLCESNQEVSRGRLKGKRFETTGRICLRCWEIARRSQLKRFRITAEEGKQWRERSYIWKNSPVLKIAAKPSGNQIKPQNLLHAQNNTIG